MLQKITDVSSKFGKIHYFYRENGKKRHGIIGDFLYYFYTDPVSKEFLEPIRRFCNRITKHPSGLYKVYCNNDNLNRFDLENGRIDNKTILVKHFLKHNVKTYEADFSPEKRWMIDESVKVDGNPVICFLDIETDDDQDGIMIGRDQILSFAFSVHGKSYFRTNRDERTLLLQLKDVIERADIICTWNGTNFDIPYILARFQYHGIKFYKSNIVHFDLMEIFKKRYKYSDQEPLTNFNLEFICQLFLGKGKIKHAEKIKWLFDHALDRLEEYNKEDVNLLHELDAKIGIMDLIKGVCSQSHTPYRNYYISEFIDNYILQEAKVHGIILPSNMWKLENREGSSEKGKFTGGFVQEPVIGLHDKVDVYDLNSQYPNTMITFNLSPETYLGKVKPNDNDWIKTPTGCYFKKSQKGIIPIFLEKLMKIRIDLKNELKKYDKKSEDYRIIDNRQNVTKVFLNGTFGLVGSTYSRYYNIDIAESITETSQYIIKWLHKYVTLQGKQVIASDTDSLFIKDIK